MLDSGYHWECSSREGAVHGSYVGGEGDLGADCEESGDKEVGEEEMEDEGGDGEVGDFEEEDDVSGWKRLN